MQPPRSKTDAFAAIPVPRPEIRAQVTKQNLVRISYPAAFAPWITRLVPVTFTLPTRTLELDSMGSFVWNLIDGKASVQDLARHVADHYACHPAEAEQAVAAFIRQLGQRGILGLR